MELKAHFILAITFVTLAGCRDLPWIAHDPVAVFEQSVIIARVPNDLLVEKKGEKLSGSVQFSEVIQFDLTSNTDLIDYFRNREIQVRCTLDGGKKHTWLNFGYGPYHNGVDLSEYVPPNGRPESARLSRDKDGKYSYVVYVFNDLNAMWLENGITDRQTPLEALRFTQISCYIIGVAKSPVSFPQSTNFGISRDELMMLIKKRSTPNKA